MRLSRTRGNGCHVSYQVMAMRRTSTKLRIVLYLALAVMLLPPWASYARQQSGQTVRHHRVEEPADEALSPEVEQAEAALQKQDYATAETLLKEAIAANQADYRAWFDLGFVYNQTKRPDDAIAAYGNSVALKAEVFESNLNLGIMLARQGNKDEAAKYLRTATKLNPTAHESEGLSRAWLSLGLVEEPSDPPPHARAEHGAAAKAKPEGVGPASTRRRASGTPRQTG